MIRLLLSNIIKFILLLLLQLAVFNNIQFSGYINPYIYVLFILLLPMDTPKWFLLILAFGYGITLDLFMGTPGLHASATLLMAFLKPWVLSVLAPRDGYPVNTLPCIHDLGFNWYLKYSAILISAHHLVLFYMEAFTMADFFHTLLRVILSTFFTLIFTFFLHYIVFRK